MRRRFLAPPDVLDRRVLFCVELIDPITQLPVWRGIKVTADGLQAKPIVNHSGRLVWLFERNAWPGAITVDPGTQPYLPHVQPGPVRPLDILTARQHERLVRIVLRPTAAYPFDTGVTVVRGTLKERLDMPDAPVVPGALVQLAWQDSVSDVWTPGPPQPGELWPETGARGEFAALLRLPPSPPADPDIDRRLLKVRVQVTRFGSTRTTPENFPFLPNAADAGRVPEGQLLRTDVMLGWNELTPI